MKSCSAWLIGMWLTFSLCAQAQVIRPIDYGKKSDMSTKQFGTKEFGAKTYETKQFPTKENYATKEVHPHEFYYSSKNFDTKTSNYATKSVETQTFPSKDFAGSNKEVSTSTIPMKEMKINPLTPQIADKPTTSSQALTRKGPPTANTGRWNDVPFSRWKSPDEKK